MRPYLYGASSQGTLSPQPMEAVQSAHHGCPTQLSCLTPCTQPYNGGRVLSTRQRSSTQCSANLGWAVKTSFSTELRSPSLSGAKCPLWPRRRALPVRRPRGVTFILEWEINLILSSHTDKNPEPLKTLNTPSYCLTPPRASPETLHTSLPIVQTAYILRRCPRPCRNLIVLISEFYI